jgi:hypothetical protein
LTVIDHYFSNSCQQSLVATLPVPRQSKFTFGLSHRRFEAASAIDRNKEIDNKRNAIEIRARAIDRIQTNNYSPTLNTYWHSLANSINSPN